MKILVSGSSGLVGSQLVKQLVQAGHTVVALVRRRDAAGVFWNPETGEIDAAGLEGCEAVFHLAGENVADGRWSEAKKQRIRRSRVDGTNALCGALATLEQPPATLVCASAVGFYGDRGDEPCDETSEAGSGFLASTCQQWEAAAQAARDAGIRVVHARIGIVLAVEGGALAKMLLPFKLGLGPVLGNGNQYFSWISLRDLVAVLQFCLDRTELSGPVNAVSPDPVTNLAFTKALAKVLGRPTFLSVPSFVLKTLAGEMAEETLLAGAKVIPVKLEQAGFEFADADLESALHALLDK